MPEIQMPKLSDTMTEGTLVSWKKKKGDKVSTGEVIAEIETDKATMEWESPEDGILTEVFVEEGGKVNVGDKIAFIGEEGEKAPMEEKKEKSEEAEEEKKKDEKKPPTESEKPVSAKQQKKETAPPQETLKTAKREEPNKEEKPKPRPTGDEARVKASPVARRVAAELGVDLSSVKGTGPEGRVTETDVRGAAQSGASSNVSAPAISLPIKAGEGVRSNLSGMRKVIAQRLVASKAPVPHFYLNIDIDAGPLMAARAELISAGEGTDASKITVNDFVLKAAVMSAVKVPEVNASFDNDAIV